jgi:hypothetical protein
MNSLFTIDPNSRFELERRVEHLRKLGPRSIGEFLLDFSNCTPGDLCSILDLLSNYQEMEPATVHALGGNRFPRPLLRLVPR